MTDILWDERAGAALPDGWEEKLSEVLKLGIKTANAPENCEISISFVTKDEMRGLNEAWRKIGSETDVLSFPFFEGEALPKNNSEAGFPAALGEIVICTDVAQAQAEEYGHSYMRELAFLTAHGLLHLLGYDHETDENEKIMFALQDDILNQAGILR